MKSILKLPIIIWCLVTLIVYGSVWVSPETFKYSALISLGIPFLLIINLVFFLFMLFTRPKRAILPALLLIIGLSFIQSTFSISRTQKSSSSFQVLSYNMMRMNKGNEKAMLEWITSNTADIKFFQEFLGRSSVINTISEKGEYNSFVGGYANSYAIFSKYPILNRGVFYEKQTTNNILFADLKIGKDTLRVYNVHLQSMGIDVDQEVIDQGEFEKKYEKVRRKFQDGSVRRAAQINDLLEHAKECRYPILIAGDFNDIPYGYNYFKVSRKFNNAFEDAGNGFGFTYNGKLPFLRIDNQFYNNQLKVLDFTTLNEIDYSDHFPVVGIYSISY
ncbi:endonuclease/exonuclease/phosphatase family protein [Roseivirga sp.]|uniref:endonuclease/exonuclease/phosphatase family protein n=1 Tax=Roseivirga sp. TaxID=1964215 RepID=UPI002B267845|nr:endonuclease/exonuclease/phosphatase family protein [Roseivirga sp.]